MVQFRLAFTEIRMHRDTGDGTDVNTLLCLEVADALRAPFRPDLIMFRTRINGLVGTKRLADIAIDACVGDHQCHTSREPAYLP